MKKITFYNIVYTIVVALGGFMAFWQGEKEISIFEVLTSLLLGISFFFIKKKFFYILFSIFAGFLFFFYGYLFTTTIAFFSGIMAAISAFLVFNNIKNYFNIT